MSAISIKGLTKKFGETTAVDAIDLRIESGELYFLLGPSGCGKTTLLRMIAGFIEPTGGTIHFGDKNVTHLPPNKRNAGMVFQSYALWPHMTVFDNVAYGLTVRKIPTPEKRERVLDALKAVRMQDFAARKPNQLSGGQQQRVALARALVIEPTVLLLDEPLSNLDAKLRLEMRSEILRLCSETKITTVYVTHDQKEALSMASRIAVMRLGKAMQVGEARELYERPNSRFVADFLGETNFISGTIESAEGNRATLDTPAGGLLSTVHHDDLPDGGNVTCSIRPEALKVVDQPAKQNNLTGKRVQTIYLGEVAQHLVELEDGTVVKSLELHPSHFGEVGDAMRLAVDPSDVVLLTD
ncbi:MAG: ABC transporter ATP-binding protein [Phycisphaerales bacterium]|nr:MAG: ABC transporter ATP-binding protein [Phycisphaerales bacterium]